MTQPRVRGSTTARGYGRAHQLLRARWAPVVAAGGIDCARCGQPITPGTPWDLGHDDNDRAIYTGPEHATCNRSTNGRKVQTPGVAMTRRPSFSLSPPEVEVRAELRWDPARLAAYGWLSGLLDVPDDAAPPLAMSLPPADAVGSYGAQAVEWIERELGITLRWWQRLAIVRQLEHRAEGSLCWRAVVESCPRRAGKSVRIRGVVLWRMAHAELFGERQEVVHSGSDIAVCRKVQKEAWRWAQEREWTVMRANGKEAIETPDGDTWLVRAQSATYGWDTTLAVVDEGWDVSPDTVSEGLEPSMLERLSPQLHLTSTAHRRATSLMRTRLRDALAVDDGETLLLLWAAPPGADPGSPATWRAASPHWSEDRRRMIEAKYAAALAGEADPQADDVDPMSAFSAQYLNVWQLRASAVQKGDEVIDDDGWADLAVELPEGPPAAAAVESWFGEGASLALAWRLDAGRVVVSVRELVELGDVPGVLAEVGYKRKVKVGASLLGDPGLQGVPVTKGVGRTGAAVAELRRFLDEDALRHDGSVLLAEQVLAARTAPSADGVRMVSSAPADAVKAAVWATTDARRPALPALVVA